MVDTSFSAHDAGGVRRAAPRYYEHSGRSSGWRSVAGFVLAMLVASPVAWLYAWAQYNVPYLVLSAALPFVYGAALGVVNAVTLHFAKVRSRKAAFRLTMAVVFLAHYVSWAAWVALRIDPSFDVYTVDVMVQPMSMAADIAEANRSGPWSLGGIDFKGLPLWFLWAIEFLIVLALALVIGLANFLDLPFCEHCNRWCRKRSNVVRFWHADDAVVKQAIEFLDFSRIRSFERVDTSAQLGQWYECDIESCPTCANTNTLDVSRVHAAKNEKGETERRTNKSISNLLLTAEDVDSLCRLGPER